MYKFVPSPNYSKRKEKIDTIVIHFTANGSLDGAVSWFKNPNSKVSAHYLIDRDGTIVQMVKEQDKAWHAGRSSLGGRRDVNQRSIGIELVNWGKLRFYQQKWRCWPDDYHRLYNAPQYGHPVDKNGQWWAPYPERQLKACIKLCEALRLRYDDITEDKIVGHMHISAPRKVDPGPHFPFERLRKESRPAEDDDYKLDVPESQMQEKQKDRAEEESWVTRLLKRWRSWRSSTRTKSQ